MAQAENVLNSLTHDLSVVETRKISVPVCLKCIYCAACFCLVEFVAVIPRKLNLAFRVDLSVISLVYLYLIRTNVRMVHGLFLDLFCIYCLNMLESGIVQHITVEYR